jgi:formylglycine-generating enzyme required for sulfatase activity
VARNSPGYPQEVLFLLACTSASDTGQAVDTAPDTAPVEGPCPADMSQVGDGCISSWEVTITDGVASAIAGVLPTVNVTWYDAVDACLAADAHLCTVAEWQEACGEGSFPWGEEPPAEEVCAAASPDGTTTWTELQPTGSLPDCRSPEGVYDQLGNAWEWADPETAVDGTPVTAKLGGAFYAGGGSALCTAAAITDHPPDFEGTIGARCCRDARE